MAFTTEAGVSAGTGYAEQLETLRSAAKWLVAALAGIGALLVAGLQLAGISRLPATSWRLYVALAAAGIALLSVGYMIKLASNLLTQEWLTLADFADEVTGGQGVLGRNRKAAAYMRPIADQLDSSRHELFGYAAASLGELNRKLHRCHETMWLQKSDDAARHEAAQQSMLLRAAARDVVQAANYYYVMCLFREMRIRLALAAFVGVACISTFAYVIPSSDPAPMEVRIVTTSQTGR
jgi:hypothetical protein